jgi:hypothetical protein
MSKFASSSKHHYGSTFPSIARMNKELLRDTHAQRHCCKPRIHSEDRHPFHDPYLRRADKIHIPVPPEWEDSGSEDGYDGDGGECTCDEVLSMTARPSSSPSCSSLDRESEEEACQFTFTEVFPVEQSQGGEEEIIQPECNPVSRLSSVAAPVINSLSLPRSGVADSRRFLLKKASSHKW